MTIFTASLCPICGRSAGAPFRSYGQDGKVVLRCVDHFHTGHLVSPSESSFWHERPEAKRVRAALRAARGGAVTVYDGGAV